MRPFLICGLGFATLASSHEVWAAKITSIDFKGTGDPIQIEVHADGPVTLSKQENPEDRQVVLEFKGATISKSAARKIDTSSFNNKVALVSPYQVQGQADTVRVVIQLREPAAVEVAQQGNTYVAKIPNTGAPPISKENTPPSGSTSVKEDGSPAENVPAPPPTENKGKLGNFMESRETQRFHGKPVTIQVRDMDIADVFRLIGEASGFNIILGEDVKGKITLSLVEVPWDQALDVILHTLGLGADRTNNILRIMSLGALTAEKENELRAIRAAEANAPRVTKVFPISYANLTDLEKLLTSFGGFGVQAAGAPGGAGGTRSRSIVTDNRTNSLIVRDLPENVERIQKLLEFLDTQTPQVLIEGKIIEASENFGTKLNGGLGFGRQGGNNQYFATMNQHSSDTDLSNPLDRLIGDIDTFTGRTAADSGKGGGSLGLSVPLSFLQSARLNAFLQMNESEDQIKVISSPKAVVLNKESAVILDAEPVPNKQVTITGNSATTTVSLLAANLKLEVKPTVTNDGSVLLELTLTRDEPRNFNVDGNQVGAVANRNIKTIVLVESGTTLVMGGFYVMRESKNSSGFPILRKIPIIGWLFGSEGSSMQRNELFFFITPQILNVKKAGLNS